MGTLQATEVRHDATGRPRGILVDWRAAIIAGLIAGALTLALNLLLVPGVIGGNAALVLRYYASLILGPDTVDPALGLDAGILLVAVTTQLLLSVLCAAIIAFVVHRGGVIMGAVGGAILGASFYLIEFYALTYFFPWFFALTSTVFLLTHILFGLVAGVAYEMFERDTYEEMQGER